jgi:uncharacterized tellurite resistance protein B-like protein
MLILKQLELAMILHGWSRDGNRYSKFVKELLREVSTQRRKEVAKGMEAVG